MANPNKTIIISDDIERSRNERKGNETNGTIYPGMLVEEFVNTNQDDEDQVKALSLKGARSRIAIVLEDDYQGRTVDDAYDDGDQVFYKYLLPGDVAMFRLAAGELAVKDDKLVSLGNGYVGVGHTLNLFSSAASGAVSNTTNETSFGSNLTIPGGQLRAGDKIKIRGYGNCPSTASTDTLTVKLKLGTAVIKASSAVDVANDAVFTFDALVTIVSVGSSGSFVASGTLNLANTTGNAATFTTNATTANTLGDLVADVTATWSAASTSDQAILRQLEIEWDQTNGGELTLAIAKDDVDLSEESSSDFIKARVAA